MSRTAVLISGAVMLALGFGITALSYSAAAESGGGRYVIATGLILVGVFRLFRGAMMSPQGDRTFGYGDIRRPEDLRPQIAGMPCAQCEKRIFIATEGALCEKCERPCHRECLAAHARAAHTEASAAPFR
jgi:hypothetical protein